MFTLSLQTLFFLAFSASCNFWWKTRHDVLCKRNREKWAFRVRFYANRARSWAGLYMAAVAVDVRGFKFLRCPCFCLLGCVWAFLRTPPWSLHLAAVTHYFYTGMVGGL